MLIPVMQRKLRLQKLPRLFEQGVDARDTQMQLITNHVQWLLVVHREGEHNCKPTIRLRSQETVHQFRQDIAERHSIWCGGAAIMHAGTFGMQRIKQLWWRARQLLITLKAQV